MSHAQYKGRNSPGTNTFYYLCTLEKSTGYNLRRFISRCWENGYLVQSIQRLHDKQRGRM